MTTLFPSQPTGIPCSRDGFSPSHGTSGASRAADAPQTPHPHALGKARLLINQFKPAEIKLIVGKKNQIMEGKFCLSGCIQATQMRILGGMNNFVGFFSSLGWWRAGSEAGTESPESPQTHQYSHESPAGQPEPGIHGCNSQHRESEQGKGPLAWLQSLGAAPGAIPIPNPIQTQLQGRGHTWALPPAWNPWGESSQEAIPGLLITPGALGTCCFHRNWRLWRWDSPSTGTTSELLLSPEQPPLSPGTLEHKENLTSPAREEERVELNWEKKSGMFFPSD